MQASKEPILVVDDEPVVGDVLKRLLEKEGYWVEVASDAASARGCLESDTPWGAVLLDVMLPDADGLTVLRWLREFRPELSVVMITAFGTVENAVAAMRLGAFHYLAKPFQNDDVRHLVKQAVSTTSLRRENRQLKDALHQRSRFEKIVGRSRPMQEVYRFIDQVAVSRSNVLIFGESGTGKELVAQALHKRSPRGSGPFVVVNSTSIPTDLLEDNLFGHVRGAFTGATSAKQGLLETANGGTILFDEISSISGDVQAKLLRVIQEKEFLPLGAVESKIVDVRILAATNESLRDLVAQGRFREDLYYRLNVIRVNLPPLRDRAEDVPMLLAHFLEKYCEENGKPLKQFTHEAVERLVRYPWPGNVRELENLVERGVVLSTRDEIGLDLLPREVFEEVSLPAAPALPEGMDFYGAVTRFERGLIEAALRSSNGVQKQAAERLGLKPTTLNEKIKRMGIDV